MRRSLMIGMVALISNILTIGEHNVLSHHPKEIPYFMKLRACSRSYTVEREIQKMRVRSWAEASTAARDRYLCIELFSRFPRSHSHFKQ